MMKRRNVVMGVILASVLIAAVIIQATFGGSVGGGVKVEPTEMPLTQNTTKTFTIILQSPQSDRFDVEIIPGTCDMSWFSWVEEPPVRVEPRVPTLLYLDVRPTESGDFYFKVRAESSTGGLFESGKIWIISEPPPTPSPTPPPTAAPMCVCLMPEPPSPQKIMTKDQIIDIKWTASAYPDSDTILYRFCWTGPGTGGLENCSKWKTSNEWIWPADADDAGGVSHIYADVRDGSDYGESCESTYNITLNEEPYYACLIPNTFPPKPVGTKIIWTACARDPEGDQDTLYYRFLVDGYPWSKWSKDNTWTWDTTFETVGPHQIMVRVTDSWDPPSPDDPRTGEATNIFEYLLE